jgi:Na+-transporting methylmalonyl-CoA/oxaloacetate decarboxylase gamma subunit
MIVSGVAEPLQQQAILFQAIDVVGVGIWALHLTLIALVLSAVGEARRQDVQAVRPSPVSASFAAAAA